MSDKTAILLVPTDGDPYKLLAPSVPFARPPLAHRGEDWTPGWKMGGSPCGPWFDGVPPNPESYWTNALVLVWDGEIVPDGVFRLWHRADDVLGDVLLELLGEGPDVVVEIASGLRRNGEPLGEVVVWTPEKS